MKKLQSRLRATVSLAALPAAATLAFAPAARADNLTVSTAITTPVSTATAANNSPGNVTITTGGSIITSTGTSVTINSNNSVTNGTTIGSSAASGGVGVSFSGGAGLTNAIFTNNGTVNLTGTGGSGNVGVLISGGPVSGTIASGVGSSVSVAGDSAFGLRIASAFTGDIAIRSVAVTGANSTAISVEAPVTGNLSLRGSGSGASGAGGYGILVAAPVSGQLYNGGSLTVGTQRATDNKGEEVAGDVGIAGVAIRSNVGKGFVNDRFYVDANGAVVPPAQVDTTKDTLVTASVITTGTAPALLVETPGAITLGAAGTGSDAYAIVNRGVFQVVPAKAGQAVEAVRIGGGGGTVQLTGGISNQANGTIFATGLDANAVALHVAAGATVPAIANAGVITAGTQQLSASGSIPAGPGGDATGILLDAGANVAAITNSGTISAVTTGDNRLATAILDKSGKLVQITNSGTISASSAGTIRAIDLSASGANVTLANSGTITGDVRFGTGFSTLAVSGGSISGAIAFGAGGGTLALSGSGVFSSSFTSPVAIGATLADSSTLDLSGQAGLTLASLAATGSSTVVVPVTGAGTGLQVAGAASFTGTSRVRLSLQSLAENQNLTVIRAGGGITTDHLSTLIDTANAPYLFSTSAPAIAGNDLVVSVTRRPTAEIGFTPAEAALYEASITGLAASPTEAALIANLGDQQSVQDAYTQLLPPSFGGAALKLAQSFLDFGFGSAFTRLASVDEQRRRDVNGWQGWAQEFGVLAREKGNADEDGYEYSGFGLAAGADRELGAGFSVGLGFVFNGSVIDQLLASNLTKAKVKATTEAFQPYVSWTGGNFFVQGGGLFGLTQYRTNRDIAIGNSAYIMSADWDGTTFAAGGTVGARFHIGPIRLTPSNTVSWVQVEQGSYQTSGVDAFAIEVSKQTDSALTNTAKLEAAWERPLNDGILRVFGEGGYVAALDRKAPTTRIRYLTDSTIAELPGKRPASSQFTYGGGANFNQGGFFGRISYERRETGGSYAQSFLGTLSLDF